MAAAALAVVALCCVGRSAHAGPFGPSLDEGDEGSYVMADDSAVDDAADTGVGGGSSCDLFHLADGVQLPDNPALYTIWDARNAWGTPRLIDVLTDVSEEMLWKVPDADPLMIGDMSRRGGGYLHGHRSHRGGLDADVGIYSGHAQQSTTGLRTVAVSDLDLDTNLTFVLTLLGTGEVERILLDRGHIAALRRYAIDSGRLTEEEAHRIFILPGDGLDVSPFSLDGVVHHVPGHKHHFHVRVRCGD